MRPLVRRLAMAIWVILCVSWPLMLLLAWDAFTTVPSAERLSQSHMEAIPSLRTMVTLAVRSAVELTTLLLLLWPWGGRHYATRAAVAVLLLAGYFLFTTPLSITTVEWVHRRWLAFIIVALLAAWPLAALAGRHRREE